MQGNTVMARAALLAGALGIALAASSAALSQSGYPNRPIRILVGFAPGGPSDIISRVVGAKMGEIDVEVAQLLTELLRTQDLAIADQIAEKDDDLDELHLSVFEKVLSENWQGEAMATVDATLASRYLERFGDHAESVSKKVLYLATGEWSSVEDEASF
mgnify:CR=1 FL=1